MASHAPTWKDGEDTDIAVNGAIAFIEKNGEREGTRLLEVLGAADAGINQAEPAPSRPIAAYRTIGNSSERERLRYKFCTRTPLT